jgi:hypothetical protein
LFGNSGQFYSGRDWEERRNLQQDSMGSNSQPLAHEVGVKTTVPTYSVNNITMGPEHVDARAIQV